MYKRLNIVFTGEVDCGKSTLIGRLLYDTSSVSLQAKEELEKTCKDLGRGIEYAYLLDSFQEERSDEFTLDTTQAVLKIKDKDFLLIDVPGHKQLLKNMLTGTSYADMAVLVVDINKSLEEQAKRHLYILKFLGIDSLVIVINKMDSIGYAQDRYLKVKEEIKVFLKELNYNDIQIIPVSAREGENLFTKSKHMKWDNGIFFKAALDNFIKKEHAFDFRFPVQDIYELKKEKISVGMVASGAVKKGDSARVSFSDIEFIIKAIKQSGRSKQSAGHGESIGLIFSRQLDGIKRGSIIYAGKPLKVLSRIQAKIFCLEDLTLNEKLSISCSTQEACGEIRQIKKSTNTKNWQKSTSQAGKLEALDIAEVAIVTESPLVVESFRDLPALARFILRKDGEIAAIGVVD